MNLILEKGVVLKEKEEKYVIGFPEGEFWEAKDFKELATIVCGDAYLEAEETTAWGIRKSVGTQYGMFELCALDLLDEEEDEEEEFLEDIILYDERIGKIPYSYTDDPVDYDIHVEDPRLIRLECDESFVLSLALNHMIILMERKGNGEYELIEEKILEKRIQEVVEPFKKQHENVPFHKRLKD